MYLVAIGILHVIEGRGPSAVRADGPKIQAPEWTSGCNHATRWWKRSRSFLLSYCPWGKRRERGGSAMQRREHRKDQFFVCVFVSGLSTGQLYAPSGRKAIARNSEASGL